MGMRSFLSFAEDDGDVAEALLDASGATHRARTPAAHVVVGGLVDERRLDEQAVDVDPRSLRAGVGARALDELLDDGRRALAGELEQLKRLAGLAATHQVHDDAGLAHG